MIELHTYLAFVASVLMLMLIPGPNVAMIVANSVGHGTRTGLMTVAGTSSGMVVQLTLTAIGLSAVLGEFGTLFEWVRWAGVAYLIYLGVKQWRGQPTKQTKAEIKRTSPGAAYRRGLLVCLTNPKTLLFYGAVFPQFMDDGHSFALQIGALCATFLALGILVDSLWAILAGRARALLTLHARLRDRIAGTLMIGAGLGLALARRR